MKKTILCLFVEVLLILIFSTSVFADYYQDLANKMLVNVASANSAKDIFNSTNSSQYTNMSRDLESFLFSIYKQNDTKSVEEAFKHTNSKIDKDEEYRKSLFEILNLMNELKLLDKEMIDIAKDNINKSNHPAGPQYDDFSNIPEVVSFYANKYNDKWVGINSKEWIYSAAVSDIIKEKAKRSLIIGEKLNNDQLVSFGEKLYCSLGNYGGSENLCISSHKTYMSVKANVDANKLISESKLQAEKAITETEAQIEVAQQEQRAMREIKRINEEKQSTIAFQQKNADEENEKLQKMKDEKNSKIEETMKKLGVPDYLFNEESETLGYTQSNGISVGSGLLLKNIIMDLDRLGCDIDYDEKLLSGNNSYSISSDSCNIIFKKESYPGMKKDLNAKNLEFSVEHQKYNLVDYYLIKEGKFGNENLSSEVTYALLSGLRTQ